MKFFNSFAILCILSLSTLNAAPKTYMEVANNWKVYVDNVSKKISAKGMLPYEEQLNKVLLQQLAPISDALQKYKNGKKEEKLQILQLTQQNIQSLTIIENEIKRAENIRILFAKVKKAREVENYKAIEELQDISIKIRQTQLEIAKLNKSYIDIYKTLNLQSQQAIDANKNKSKEK